MVQAAARAGDSNGLKAPGRVVSAESYLAEPPDLWRARLPAAWRDRGPRLESGPYGDEFRIDGAAPRPLGFTAPLAELARIGIALPPPDRAYRYADDLSSVDRDPGARVAWQQQAGLGAEVLYPRLGLLISTTPEPELQELSCRVYNDWLAEYCAVRRDRLLGMALLPARARIETIVSEVQHAADLGLVGVTLPARRGIVPYNMPDWDPVWQAVGQAGLLCAVHLGPEEGAALTPKGPGAAGILLSTGQYELNEFLQMMVWSGAAMRHPALRLILVGSGTGWLATQVTLMDHWWNDHKGWMLPRLEQAPSHYWHRQFFATFSDDRPGLATREIVGVDNLLWGCGRWGAPSTAVAVPVSQALAGLSDAEAAALAGRNASRLFGLPPAE